MRSENLPSQVLKEVLFIYLSHSLDETEEQFEFERSEGVDDNPLSFSTAQSTIGNHKHVSSEIFVQFSRNLPN